MGRPVKPNKRLRRARELQGWAQKDVAERLNRLGPRVGKPRLSITPAMISRWEREGVRPRPPVPELLCHLFKATAEDLGLVDLNHQQDEVLAPVEMDGTTNGAEPDSISDLVHLAAQDSATFVREIAATSNRSALLEQLHGDVHRLAIAYLTTPPAEILAETLPIRETAFRVIRTEREPTCDKDLLLLSGYLSGILAYAALDLGFGDEAVTNARAAWLAADLAGHNGLRAWVRGTQSLIARWQANYHTA